MKKFLTTILAFLGLLALGVTLGADAATEHDVKYTVDSKSSVSCNDDSIEWVSSFNNTYTSGAANQITSNNSMTFTLTGLDDVKITKIVMSTHTNASKGAGTVKVTIGETDIYDASYDKANGTSWVDYEIENADSATGDLTIVIACTTNSLYCESFHIYYEKAGGENIPAYNTIFDYNYDGAPENSVVSTDENDSVRFVSDPQRNGYIFVGWFDAAEGGTQVDSLISNEENSDKVLYAHWIKDPYNYAIINNETGNIAGSYIHGSHTLMDGETKDFDFVITDVMKNSSRMQFKKDTGYLYNSTSVRGLIASIEIEFDTSEITVYTSDKPLTDSSSLTGGVVLSKDNPIYTLEDVEHSYFAIKNESGSVTYILSIKIQYTYEENFAETIGFINSETKTSLKAEYDSELNPIDVDLRFGAKISLDAYNEDAVYGVMVVAADEYAGFAAGATDYTTADEFLAANTGVKKMECSEGALLTDGYQFAWVITDMEGHYTTSLTAVIYMEYNGVLYLAICTTDSVVSVAEYYVDHSEELGLTAEQTEVMMNIAIVEE